MSFVKGINMDNLNYFSLLCFVWAFIALGSRAIILYLGEHRNKWELQKVFSLKKPGWIYSVAVISVLTVGYTWLQVWFAGIRYSWIIAALITLTLIKVFMVLFNYQEFHSFVKEIQKSRQKLTKFSFAVTLFVIACVLMGIYLY